MPAIKKPRVLLIHPGTQYSYDLARELNERGLLYKFCTGFGYTTKSFLDKLSFIFPVLKKRHIKNITPAQLITFPLLEIKAVIQMRKTDQWEDILYERNKKFQNRISDALLQEADVVIGFDTASWIIAERCNKLGKKFILDVSIGHPASKEKVYDGIKKMYPEWGSNILPKENHLIEKERMEMELADIVTVPSNFVKRTYIENGIEEKKIYINSFGTNIQAFKFTSKKMNGGEEINFLFFGTLTARKGLPLLLETWEEIQATNANLILAGYGQIPSSVNLPDRVFNRGPILKEERQQLFDSAHVFVFPSYFEGLAQVQIEAAACGLPVIGTFNSGAEELVQNEKNGFVIEAGSKNQLKEAIQYFINNKRKIEHMGAYSRKMAEQFPWEAYGARWEEIIYRVMNNSTGNV